MSESKSSALLLTITILLTCVSTTSLLQPPPDAYSQTDYEEYIMESNTEQELNQENIGSGSSININCGTNTIIGNSPQAITTLCPSVPGQSPTPNGDFDTATFSRIIRLAGSGIGTAEVSCPEGTDVTGGGYELSGVTGDDAHTLMDAPKDNGWRASINFDDIGEDAFLTVYVICGALGDIPVEICDDGVDNDGDKLVDGSRS